jgi:NAD(P)-dependent dehydrogenase (short-subunit alcohol dehydrogenase family)
VSDAGAGAGAGEPSAGVHAGRVALIFGGTSGIGRGAALELAAQGAAVAIHGLDEQSASDVAAEVTALGGRAIGVSGPIDDEATAIRAVADTIAAFGRLDSLVLSAGIQRYGDVVSTPRETWDEVFAVNVTGAYLAAKHALPHLRDSPNGSVVIVASVQASAAQSQVAAYSASKGALVALARSMAVDEAPFGVRVNSVSPGSVDTPMLRASAALFGDGTPDGIERTLANWGSSHALGRIAQVEEIGSAISYLCSPRASFITGIDLKVDGGLTAALPVPLPEKE